MWMSCLWKCMVPIFGALLSLRQIAAYKPILLCCRGLHNTSMVGVFPVRLREVAGFDGRINDLIYCPPASQNDSNTAVVFFGGDVQDFPENMESHRDNKDYVKWNLEDTSLLLHNVFPEAHIIVIRPSRNSWPDCYLRMDKKDEQSLYHSLIMELKMFSCYNNFVPSNDYGAPEHTPTNHALQHLERLLHSAGERLRSMTPSDLAQIEENWQEHSNKMKLKLHMNCEPESSSTEEVTSRLQDDAASETEIEGAWWQHSIRLEKSNLTLIGFSKGCVVLNQLLYEFHYMKTLTPDDDTMMRLVSRIRHMYWLDGGHAGGKNTWITSRSLLETLTRLGIQVHVHVTPYQVQDDRRPWIRKEEKCFTDLLRRLGAPVHRTLHFENQQPNLHMHFEVLTSFGQVDGSVSEHKT